MIGLVLSVERVKISLKKSRNSFSKDLYSSCLPGEKPRACLVASNKMAAPGWPSNPFRVRISPKIRPQK